MLLEAIGSQLRHSHFGIHADSTASLAGQHVVTNEEFGSHNLNALSLAVSSNVLVLANLIAAVFQQDDQNGTSSFGTEVYPDGTEGSYASLRGSIGVIGWTIPIRTSSAISSLYGFV